MAPPKALNDLVERFDRNRDAYQAGAYNETQVRREFVDPLFALLGWDINNTRGYAQPYKEVIHEDSIKIGTATRAPDYSFRIGGARKFFVETKKPSVNVKDDVSPAYQLRRYAWSAKLPLSILTDFEEFSVYDCRIKPGKSDTSSTGRIIYLTFDKYPAKWEEIASVFSRDAILKGSFDQYAESTKGKKGTAEVDDAFLREIETWRDILARTIALRNPALTIRELNFSVGRIIDRIIFLRICEDRGIELYGKLLAATNGPHIYDRLCELFRSADERYNSGLFHFRKEKDRAEDPDLLTTDLAIDDEPLKTIIKNLYYPDSPYEFSVLPADILGQVYEQFLGKVIRLTEGHRAKVEEKPEVKKAGGVYYTPTYIVEYIVQNTLGKLIEKKTPKQIAKLKILDPACGSGSFLINAYQRLLDYHRDWYVADGPQKHTGELYQKSGEDWRLTTAERKRILLNNIFGVDIDTQAVEVTKLSLCLKVLEGENDETLSNQLKLFQFRALPDLETNIKCGNSLIGPDFYADKQLSLLDEEESYRINVFDWKKGFADILNAGGFDVVIGNPPYVRIQAMKQWAPLEVEFYKTAYASAASGNYDIYVVFVEKALSLLNKNGLFGFILPHKFFNAKYGNALRGLLAKGKHVSHVVHFGDQQVFEGATTYTCLLFLNKSGTDECRFVKTENLLAWRTNGQAEEGVIPASKITDAEWNLTVGKGASLFDKLSRMLVKLGDVADIFVGLQTSADTVFLFKDCQPPMGKLAEVYSKELDKVVAIESELLKPVVRSGEIGRYWTHPTAQVLFPYLQENGKIHLLSEDTFQKKYPKAWHYLTLNERLLSSREHGKFRASGWYQLYPKNLDLWEKPKILIPYMVTTLSAYYDPGNLYFVNVTTGGFGVRVDIALGSLKYFTGLLNSRLLDWFFKQVSTTFHGGYFAANKQFIGQLPIRTINFTDPDDKKRHDRMVELVETMLELHRKLAETKTPDEKNVLQRRIEATDRQIDLLVYDLYGLTPEEIAIVEAP